MEHYGNARSVLDVKSHLSEEKLIEFEKGFGHKTIGWFGSFCLTMNNITGPGMVSIPMVFQQAGIITYVFRCALSSLLR